MKQAARGITPTRVIVCMLCKELCAFLRFWDFSLLNENYSVDEMYYLQNKVGVRFLFIETQPPQRSILLLLFHIKFSLGRTGLHDYN